MPLDVAITGSTNSVRARITNQGELKVSASEFSIPVKQTMDGTGVFSFFPPKTGEKLIITGIILNASRSVTNEALITIFEAASVTGTSVTDILAVDVAKSTTIPLLGLNLEVNTGVWVNATTDDPTCNVTILAHYVRHV